MANYHSLIREFKRSRKRWIDILTANPNDSSAAQTIIHINNNLELLNNLRYQEGDYEQID